ncbi:MAG: hypothetical protein NC434_14070 [Ruminococcus sp.]|nr:hypothetical protein [Ruminococcus sp.]
MKKNYIITAIIMAFTLTVLTACGGGQIPGEADTLLPPAEKVEEPSDVQPPESNPDTDTTVTSDAITPDMPIPDTTIIGGKVRSVSQDSFVISRTLVEDSYVIMPEPGSPEEELVTILCTDATVYEHWTIQGGGAGIVKKEASFSDIQEKSGLEAEGYFDGETFIAEKVIIELYQ